MEAKNISASTLVPAAIPLQSVVSRSDAKAERYAHTENDVMVSYCRRNKKFVQELVAYLNRIGIDPWIDWEDIPPAVDWMQCIRDGIEQSYAFIAVLSPEYLASKICLEELDIALKAGRLIIPIVYKDIDWGDPKLPKDLAAVNFIFIRDEDDRKVGLEKVNVALHTDQDYVQRHSELSKAALRWHSLNDNHDMKADVLVQGSLLESYMEVVVSGAYKNPRPTPEMSRYVDECRKVASRQRERTFRRKLKLMFLFGLFMAAAAVVGYVFYAEAEKAREEADDANRTLSKTVLTLESTRDELRKSINFFYCSYSFFTSPCYASTPRVYPGRNTLFIYNYTQGNIYSTSAYPTDNTKTNGKPRELDCPAIMVRNYELDSETKDIFATERFNYVFNKTLLQRVLATDCKMGRGGGGSGGGGGGG